MTTKITFDDVGKVFRARGAAVTDGAPLLCHEGRYACVAPIVPPATSGRNRR